MRAFPIPLVVLGAFAVLPGCVGELPTESEDFTVGPDVSTTSGDTANGPDTSTTTDTRETSDDTGATDAGTPDATQPDGVEADATTDVVEDTATPPDATPDADAPPSDLACPELLDCIRGCDGTALDCYGTCREQGTNDAQAQAGALIECAISNCENTSSASETVECALDACPEQSAACLGTEPPPPPTLETCLDVNQCVSDCGGTQECGQDCLDRATADAADAFLALNDCAAANCQNDPDPQSCIYDKCATEVNACAGSETNRCLQPCADTSECNSDRECFDLEQSGMIRGCIAFDAAGNPIVPTDAPVCSQDVPCPDNWLCVQVN